MVVHKIGASADVAVDPSEEAKMRAIAVLDAAWIHAGLLFVSDGAHAEGVVDLAAQRFFTAAGDAVGHDDTTFGTIGPVQMTVKLRMWSIVKNCVF